MVYAREAKLGLHQGRLAAGQAFVVPAIAMRGDVESIRVERDGSVRVRSNGQEILAGRLMLAMFPAESSLIPSEGFFTSADRPVVVASGQNGAGVFAAPSAPVAPVTTPASPRASAPLPAARPSPTVLASSAERQSGNVVRVREESIVERSTFTIADVADLQGSEEFKAKVGAIALGDTPPLGLARKIDRERVMVRLRVVGVDTSTLQLEVPANATVRRPSQSIAHERFYEQAVAALRPQVGEEAQVTDLNPAPPMIVKLGDLSFTTKGVSVSGKRASVTVEVSIDGERVGSRTLSLGLSGGVELPRVGAMVTVRARSNGVRIQFAARVVSTTGLTGVVVQTQEGTRLTGVVTAPGIVEIQL